MSVSIHSKTLLFLFCVLSFVTRVEFAGAQETRSAGFRLITYNVWYGFSRVPDRKSLYRKWMNKQAPDIVALQELNGYTEKALAEDADAWGHSHVALLKTRGFPTGITSRKPIDEIRRILDGFHHGLLRARIGGVYIYVIHLHPSNWETRARETELILKDIAELPEGSEVILSGDFNALSKDDSIHYQHGELETFFGSRDREHGERNLHNGRLDYGVIDRFTAAGLTDLEVLRRYPLTNFTGSFPTKIEKPGDHGRARRLDYVFATRGIAARTSRAETIASPETWVLSDHLPVIVEIAGTASK